MDGQVIFRHFNAEMLHIYPNPLREDILDKKQT